jgi:hypothetical protein
MALTPAVERNKGLYISERSDFSEKEMSVSERLSVYSLEHRKMRLGQLLSSAASTDQTTYSQAAVMMEELLREWNSAGEYRAFITQQSLRGTVSIPEGAVVDICKTIEARASKLLDHRQVQVGNAQTGGNKDAIRAACLALAEAYWLKGDLHAAGKSISRAREACATDSDVMQVLRVSFKCHLVYESYAAAGASLQRVAEIADRLGDRDYLFFCTASAAVAMLRSETASAAEWMLRITSHKAAKLERARKRGDDVGAPSSIAVDMQAECHHFGTLTDVITFTVLAVLATCDRAKAASFFNDGDVKQLLETDGELLELTRAFVECRFNTVVLLLQAIERRVVQNYYLFQQAGQRLLGQIRDASMQIYTTCYESVALKSIAATFCMSETAMERELRRLVQAGTLSVRIDRASGYLRAKQEDVRSKVVSQIVDRGARLVDEAEQAIRVMSLQRNEVITNYLRSGMVVDSRASRRDLLIDDHRQ